MPVISCSKESPNGVDVRVAVAQNITAIICPVTSDYKYCGMPRAMTQCFGHPRLAAQGWLGSPGFELFQSVFLQRVSMGL